MLPYYPRMALLRAARCSARRILGSDLRQFSRIVPTVDAAQKDSAFLKWALSKEMLLRKAEIGHVVFADRQQVIFTAYWFDSFQFCFSRRKMQRGLFATTDIKVGEPIAAVPTTLCFGRAFHPNAKLISLTDQLFPRGCPPLRPLNPEEIYKAGILGSIFRTAFAKCCFSFRKAKTPVRLNLHQRCNSLFFFSWNRSELSHGFKTGSSVEKKSPLSLARSLALIRTR